MTQKKASEDEKRSSVSRGDRLQIYAGALRDLAMVAIVLVTVVVLVILSPYFLTRQNLSTTAIGLANDGIVVIGMLIALASGGFDLSVGSVLGLGAIVTGRLVGGHVNVGLAMLIGIGCGTAIGLINGLLISRVGVNALIATLASMSFVRGLDLVITQGRPVTISAASPAAKHFLTSIGQGLTLGIPNPVLIMLTLAIVSDILLRTMKFFRWVYAIGGNEQAAWVAGVEVRRAKTIVYMITGTLAALAGVVSLSRFTVAEPLAGTGMELRVIAAAVIGGASLKGGEGTVLGALLGVVFLALISDGLTLLNVSVYWQGVVSGVVLAAAAVFDVYSHRRRS
jgi:ribose transport system permease protein